MVARERLPVGCTHVRDGGNGRESRGAAVGARERLSVGQEHVHVRGKEVLLWLRANGCPWDRQTRDVARGEILEWAVANGVPEYPEEVPWRFGKAILNFYV